MRTSRNCAKDLASCYPDNRREAMQALKDVIEGGSPTVAWSVVQAALSEQEDQLQRRDIAVRGDAAEAGSSPLPLLEVKPRLQPQLGYPRVVLDSASLWRQFYSVTNEMIVTKAGRYNAAPCKTSAPPTFFCACVAELRRRESPRTLWRTAEDGSSSSRSFTHS